jgi:hypothetical protein
MLYSCQFLTQFTFFLQIAFEMGSVIATLMEQHSSTIQEIAAELKITDRTAYRYLNWFLMCKVESSTTCSCPLPLV